MFRFIRAIEFRTEEFEEAHSERVRCVGSLFFLFSVVFACFCGCVFLFSLIFFALLNFFFVFRCLSVGSVFLRCKEIHPV